MSARLVAQTGGTEFRVNTFTSGVEGLPAVAWTASGPFVVVWEGTPQVDPMGSWISAQRYAATGERLGEEFRVDTYTTGSHHQPAVAMDPSGAFVVVWEGPKLEDGSGSGIFARRYASSGAPLGDEFRVNTYTTGDQFWSSVGSDAGGGFVVVWTTTNQGAPAFVAARRFDASGAAQGDEFRVNESTALDETNGDVAVTPDGTFVVAWTEKAGYIPTVGYQWAVRGRRFDAAGTPQGAEFRVSQLASYGTGFPVRVASGADGSFVIAQNDLKPGDAFVSVYAQRFDASGAPLAPEFRVDTATTGFQAAPRVARAATGDFVVTWYDATHGGVSARAFGPGGAPRGPQLQVSASTATGQSSPSVAYGGKGEFVVAWSSFQSAASYDVHARRFSCGLAGDVNGDGVTNVVDVFRLIDQLFAGAPAGACPGDVNADGDANVADVFSLINYLFAGGPPPV